MIRKYNLAAAHRDHNWLRWRNQPLESRHVRLLRNQVIPSRLQPQILELRVVDEDIGRTRRIRPINQVVEPPVQQQAPCGSCRRTPTRTCSSDDRRSACPAAIDPEPPPAAATTRYGSNTTIASRAAWKNSTIINAAATNAPLLRANRSERADQERHPGHHQRQAQIRERCQRQIFHVSQRQACRRRDAASARRRYRPAPADRAP